jgi:myo-inositol-1(or 4)-monophosphatase
MIKQGYHGICARVVSEALLLLEAMSSRQLTFSEKESPRDVVSSADIALHNFICRELAKVGGRVLSEESVAGTQIAPSSNEFEWVVDPIDGTANYVSGIPFFGVSVGLVAGGMFKAGAFGIPATSELFYTAADDASYRNDVRLKASERSLDDSLVGASFSSRGAPGPWSREDEFRVFQQINDSSRGCLRLGSAGASLCYAASGKLGAAYGVSVKIWDVAAALAVASAAGCRVRVAPSANPLALHCIVGNGESADQVEAILAKTLKIETWRNSLP